MGSQEERVVFDQRIDVIEGRILGWTMVAEKGAKLGGKSDLDKVPYLVSFFY